MNTDLPTTTTAYCTQNNGDCETCSLVNYGRDCRNNPIHPPTYTLTPEQHRRWYSGDQRVHDAVHDELRGIAHEVYDLDGIVIAVED